MRELTRITRAGGYAVFSLRADVEQPDFAAEIAALTTAKRWSLLKEGVDFQSLPLAEPHVRNRHCISTSCTAPTVRRNILLGVIAVALTYLYVLALVYAIGLVAALPVPATWAGLFPTRHSGAASWILISHFVVVVLVSVPFAWMFARVFGRVSIALSMCVAVLILCLFEIPLVLANFNGGAVFPWWVWLTDVTQFAGSLPVLVLLFRRLGTNKDAVP